MEDVKVRPEVTEGYRKRYTEAVIKAYQRKERRMGGGLFLSGSPNPEHHTNKDVED